MSAPPKTTPGTVLGTVGYMAPEQVRGEAADSRSDIFAFGAIFYEMVFGRRAFKGDTSAETMYAILKQDPLEAPSPERALPPGVERVLRRCLEKSPEERFQSARDLAFHLEAISGSSDLVGPATISAATRESKSLRHRSRWLVGMAALATLAAAVAGLLGPWRASEVPPTYHQVTFRRGTVTAARFAPDGQTIVYSAKWEGAPVRLFSTRVDSPESSSLPIAGAELLSISSLGKMAIRLDNGRSTLAEVPLAGQAPRELLDDVEDADWAPERDALVVSHAVRGRTRLEYPVGSVLYDPGPGRGVAYPRFSPKGDRIAFIDFEAVFNREHHGFRIAVIDLAGHMTILSQGWSDIFALAWAPGGDEIWFSARETGKPSGGLILHAATLAGRHRVVAHIPGLPLVQEIRRDGRVLLRHDDWPLSMMCQTGGAGRERDLSWLDFSRARDLSADGRTILFDEQGFAGGPRGGVYLRRTDGSPAVRLGDGVAGALSPDGAWALAFDQVSSGQLTVLPTGPGQPRVLRGAGLTYHHATWFPDGAHLLVAGQEAGRAPAVYVQPVAGGPPRRLVDGADRGVVSPDGRTVATLGPAGSLTLTPVAGGPPRVVGGVPAGASLLRWTASDEELFVRLGDIPAQILRFNVETGRATPWRTVTPSDLSGGARIGAVSLTPDGRSYCYSYLRALSAVFVVDGLK
jgi:hypothetical protein